jgi:hypothetical protein
MIAVLAPQPRDLIATFNLRDLCWARCEFCGHEGQLEEIKTKDGSKWVCESCKQARWE